MGSCHSSPAVTNSSLPAPARLVTVDGSLKEYTSEVKVYEALGRLHPSCFICSSDDLYCNAHIPALRSQESLQLGQIYFVLPVSKLQHPLASAEMAALAIKASVALSSGSRQEGSSRHMHAQVMPLATDLGMDLLQGNKAIYAPISSEKKKVVMKRSGSFRAKLRLRRSYRQRLSIIEELTSEIML